MKNAEDNSLYILFLDIVLDVNIIDEMKKKLTILD